MEGGPRVVFLTGAARSGTTWLQNLLGSHPEIVTPQESDLLSYYVATWWREWRKSLPESDEEWAARRHNGLPSIITEAEFDEILQGVIDRVYGAAADLDPDASIVLDKVPGYGFYGGLLLRYLPDTRILHIVRDGRDVAMSMKRASQGFGRLWAPSTIDYAAFAWASTIEATRELGVTDAYAEVRYEDLRGPDGPHALSGAFEFYGVGVDEGEAEEILHRFSLEANEGRPPSSILYGGEVIQRLGETPEEPADFYGKGSTGGWEERFGWFDRWLFDRYAGETLIKLGYERDRRWLGMGRRLALLGHIRFFFSRWRVLVGSGLQKVRRNVRPRTRKIPAAAESVPRVTAQLSGGREG
jgi:hypothetical protein